MNRNEINRRNFIKKIGIGTAAVTSGLGISNILGNSDNGIIIESENEYGALPVERLSKGNSSYKYDESILEKMRDKNTVFSRNLWDEKRANRPKINIMKKNLIEDKGKNPNQTRLDYALANASWSMARFNDSPCYKWESESYQVKSLNSLNLGKWQPEENELNWEDASVVVKHAAQFYGVSLAGVAELNPLWLYSDNFSPTKEDKEKSIPVIYDGDRFEQTEDAWYIPKSMNRVVALAFEEDYEAISNSPGRLASAAVGDGYSRMAVSSFTLAEFIRALGYRAIPAGNNLGLSIPIALDAGLGELGRNGLLITPKYGPRVRIAKVITDMPLVPDSPIKFGVEEFCEECMLCADDCPSGSITKGPKTWEGPSPSNCNGSYKWYVQPESCFDYNGFSCSNCRMNCPFNKPNNSWLHKIIRESINLKIKPLDAIMVKLDQASGYGEQKSSEYFWNLSGENCITSRDMKTE